MVASCELDTDTLMLLSINHQRRLGIRLDPVTNVAEMWDEFYENWFELELAQTPSGLPVIRIDNYASERYDKIKAIRARGNYLKGQENLTMKNFYYRPDQKPHRLQFHEIEKRWDEREWTVETAIHMRKAGYYVPEKIWTNRGLDVDDYGEPEYDDIPEDSAVFVAEGKDLKEPRLAWNPKREGKPRDWNDQKT